MRSPLFVPSRPLAVALLAMLPGAAIGAAMPACAQEPLLLRIRPNAAPLPEGGGSGERVSDAEIAAQARAAREAVWQRAERRARIAIASVCTGCLRAAPPEPLPEPMTAAPSPEPSSPTPMMSPSLAPMRSAEASPPDPRPQTEGDL